MLSNNFYFELASNSTLNVWGRYVLWINNPMQLDYTYTILEGEDAFEVLSTAYNQIVIEITKANADIKIKIEADLTNYEDTVTFNSGKSRYSFSLGQSIFNISSDKGEIAIPFEIKGYTPSDITFQGDLQSVANIYGDDEGDIYTAAFPIKNHGTFDVVYPIERINQLIIDVGDDTSTGEDEFQYTKQSYSLYQDLLATGFSYAQMYVDGPDVTMSDIYVGYADNENVFVTSWSVDTTNNVILVNVAPNTKGVARTQEIRFIVGNIEHSVTINQESLPDGIFFDYDNNTLDPILSTLTVNYDIRLYMPSGWRSNTAQIQNFNPNVNGVTNPYTITPTVVYKSGSYYLRLSSKASIADIDYLNKTVEQEISFDLGIFDNRLETPSVVFYRNNHLKFRASGLIYYDGEITIDQNNNISGNLSFLTNNAVDVTFSRVPTWISRDNLLVNYYRTEPSKLNVTNISLYDIEPNLSEFVRTAEIEVTLTRPSSSFIKPYANTATLKITQVSSLASYENYHKTFEDVYADADKNVTSQQLIEVYSTSLGGYVFIGLINDKFNISKLARNLFFDKKNPFESSFINLGLLEEVDYAVNLGKAQIHYFIYDYSGDKTHHHNITELRQPIDYYDPRQYVFESVFVYPNGPRNIHLNEREYSNVEDWNKYNITMTGDIPSLQLSYDLASIRHYGVEYKQKCTNAKYALYYMNTYGGWNWMLFDGNKQVMKQNNAFSTYVNRNEELVPYKIDTSTSYDLTSLFLSDESSKKLQDLYKSPMVYIHKFDTDEIIRVTVDTKSYTEKTFINQGRKFFTQSISVTEVKKQTVV